MSELELVEVMMEEGTRIFDQWDVPLQEFFDYADDIGMDSDPHKIANDLVELFPGICDSDQATEFESALSEFKTCSSFDMEMIVETIIDAEVGAVLECVVSLAPMADHFLDIMEEGGPENLAEMELPDLCVDSLLGQNPFGDMFRNWGLHPDRMLPCFDTLSKSIPPCTLQRWPIPIIGPLLQTTTCIVGKSGPLLEEVAAETLRSMQSCIPSHISSGECNEVKMNCANEGFESLMFPKPLGGAPLSDLTKRVAMEKDMPDAVEKYDNFLQKCDPTPWKGWSYSSGNYASLSIAGSDDSPDATKGNGDFLTGMLCGIVVSAVIAVAMFLINRRRNYRQLNAKIGNGNNGIHLPELELDENSYSDDAPNTSSEDEKPPLSEAEVI